MNIENSPHLVNKHSEAEAKNTQLRYPIKTSRYRHEESYISYIRYRQLFIIS